MAENISASLGWQLADAVRAMTKRTTGPTTGTAQYVGRDSAGNALILLPGAEQATPVQGAISASAEVGSTVTYSLANGRLSITGNASDPAVGEAKATQIADVVVKPVAAAVKVTRAAADAAKSIADAAQRVASATNQHFWSGDDGIHVTEVTQEEWSDSEGASYQSGPNVLINSIGQLFRNGMNNLLSLLPAQTAADTFTGDGTTKTFTLTETPTSIVSVTVDGTETSAYTAAGTAVTLTTAPATGSETVVTYRISETVIAIWDGAGNAASNVAASFGKVVQLGRSNESHAMLDYHSLKLIDRESRTYFHVSDLRNSDGVYTYTDTVVYETPIISAQDEGLIISAQGSDSSSSTTYTFPLAVSYYTVTLDGVDDTANWTDSTAEERTTLTRNEPLDNSGQVCVFYGESTNNALKAFTFGSRVDSPIGGMSEVFGSMCEASAYLSHAEGELSHARGLAAHAEGTSTYADEHSSHAEGGWTEATGKYAHAEGFSSVASGETAHAEGRASTASGYGSHAEGYGTESGGYYSHAEGYRTKASANYSHAQGRGTVASSQDQSVAGKYNAKDSNSKYAFIIGNGTSDTNRSNAYAVAWDGTVTHATDVSSKALSLASTAVAYSDAQAPHYSRWGNVVQVYGAVKPKSDVAAGGTLTIGTLPSGCRPSQQVSVLCQGSGNSVWLLQIADTGVLTASRYRNGASASAAITTTTWLPFSVTFII